MRSVSLLVAASMAVFLAGCGGSGSSGTSGSAGSAGQFVSFSVEAVAGSAGAPPSPTADFRTLPYRDTENLQIEETVFFQYVGYTASGQRVVLQPDEWLAINDDSGTFGQLVTNTGEYRVGTSLTQRGTPVRIGAVVNGQYAAVANVQIKPRQLRLNGAVVDESTGAPFRNVEITFYNAAGTVEGTARTFANGEFLASVSPQVRSFKVVSDNLPASYQRAYRYAPFISGPGSTPPDTQFSYRTDDDFCRAQVTSGVVFSGGETRRLNPIQLRLRSGTDIFAAPAVDGCGF